MSSQSLLARLGLRLGTLGSAARLAIAAPVAEGDVSQSAHTTAGRSGFFFPTPASLGVVTNGDERIRVFSDGGVQIGGPFTLSPGAASLALNGVVTLKGTTSGSISIKAAAIAGSPTTWTMPTTNGASGYVLTTDGSGNLSWAFNPSINLGVPSAEGADRSLTNADNAKNLICTGSRTFTVNTGLVSGFGCAFKGTVAFAGTATITDVRTAGASNPWCALCQTGTDTYDIVGSKV